MVHPDPAPRGGSRAGAGARAGRARWLTRRTAASSSIDSGERLCEGRKQPSKWSPTHTHGREGYRRLYDATKEPRVS